MGCRSKLRDRSVAQRMATQPRAFSARVAKVLRTVTLIEVKYMNSNDLSKSKKVLVQNCIRVFQLHDSLAAKILNTGEFKLNLIHNYN